MNVEIFAIRKWIHPHCVSMFLTVVKPYLAVNALQLNYLDGCAFAYCIASLYYFIHKACGYSSFKY